MCIFKTSYVQRILNVTRAGLQHQVQALLHKITTKVKDKSMIILNAVPISLWPMLGKENKYFYTKHSNNNDC